MFSLSPLHPIAHHAVVLTAPATLPAARASDTTMVVMFVLLVVLVGALKAVSRIFVQMTVILKVVGTAVTSFLLVVAVAAALLTIAVRSVR
jgi:hypothetical protein